MCESLNYLPLFLNSLLKNIKVIFERVVKNFFCVCVCVLLHLSMTLILMRL